MIISKIYNSLSELNKGDFVLGLVLGLVWGLVWVLVWGLVWNLVWGLVLGLVLGLVWGLVLGLVWGLVWGLVLSLVLGLVLGLVVILVNFTEALPFISGVMPIVFLILGIFFLVEILFWLSPKEKVKQKNLISHTLKRKGEALLEVLLGLSAITQIYIFTREIDFIKYFPEILKWIGYIGAGIIILGLILAIIYGWIQLNSLKYRR